MRLLRCDFADEATPLLEELFSDIPRYAILSHCWGKPSEEISFKDLENGVDIKKKRGYKKLKLCCQQALADGFEYAWIDTCCIDKSSSAELSEAINSMYQWYMMSAVCYVFLEDVSGDGDNGWGAVSYNETKSLLQSSAWFTRGWTLQELIAPTTVRFYDQDWHFLGDKSSMAPLLSEITGIGGDVLRGGVRPVSVAQRMSWAAGRKTTRVEDMAYSLMGIFGVNMPPLYGEGERAFTRLQEEIMRVTFDHSLFAWETDPFSCELLADTPDRFASCGDVVSIPYNDYLSRFRQFKAVEVVPEYTRTNYGTRMQLLVRQMPEFKDIFQAGLACKRGLLNGLCYMYLRRNPGPGLHPFERVHIPNHEGSTALNDFADIESTPMNMYISHQLQGFSRRNISTTDIHFKLDTSSLNDWSNLVSDSIDSTGSSRVAGYMYGGFTQLLGSSTEFGVWFRNDALPTAVYVCVGVIREMRSETFIHLWAIVGIVNGRIWTDIQLPKSATLSTPQVISSKLYSSVDEIYSIRQQHQSFTEKQVKGVEIGQPRQDGASLAVKVTEERDFRNTVCYSATVAFTWLPGKSKRWPFSSNRSKTK